MGKGTKKHIVPTLVGPSIAAKALAQPTAKAKAKAKSQPAANKQLKKPANGSSSSSTTSKHPVAKTHAKAAAAPAKSKSKDNKPLPQVPVFKPKHQTPEVEAVPAGLTEQTATAATAGTPTAPGADLNHNLSLFFKPKNKHTCAIGTCETHGAGAAGAGTAGTGQQEHEQHNNGSGSDHEGSGGTGGTGGGGANDGSHALNIQSPLQTPTNNMKDDKGEAKAFTQEIQKTQDSQEIPEMSLSPNPRESEKKRAKLSAPNTWLDMSPPQLCTGSQVPLSAEYWSDNEHDEHEPKHDQITFEPPAAVVVAPAAPALDMAPATATLTPPQPMEVQVKVEQAQETQEEQAQETQEEQAQETQDEQAQEIQEEQAQETQECQETHTDKQMSVAASATAAVPETLTLSDTLADNTLVTTVTTATSKPEQVQEEQPKPTESIEATQAMLKTQEATARDPESDKTDKTEPAVAVVAAAVEANGQGDGDGHQDQDIADMDDDGSSSWGGVTTPGPEIPPFDADAAKAWRLPDGWEPNFVTAGPIGRFKTQDELFKHPGW